MKRKSSKVFARRKIVVYMLGGLGNQLNCYFAGIYLSKKLDRKLILDHSHADSSHHAIYYDSRSFYEVSEKSKHSLKIKFLQSKFLHELRQRVKSILRRLEASETYENFLGIVSDYRTSNPLNVSPMVILESLSKFKKITVRLNSYVPNFWYYEQLTEVDRRINLREKSHNFEMLMERLNHNSIVLHVRLGDQLEIAINSRAELTNLLGENYYERALLHMKRARNNYSDSNIFVFCDDLKNLKMLYPNLDNSDFIFLSKQNGDPAEELIVMSSARYFICSNSSFSLWAARLGNESKVVSVPKFLDSQEKTYPGLPDSWTRLDPEFMQLNTLLSRIEKKSNDASASREQM